MERWNEPMLEPWEREAAISAILDREMVSKPGLGPLLHSALNAQVLFFGVVDCIFLSILAAVGASAYILYCQMQLTQLTAEVSKQSDNLSEMQAENVSLTTKKMNSMDMTEVEQHAVDNLGMVKMDNSQIEYVELTRPDVVTVAHSEHSLENVVSGLTEWFSSIVEYIR